MPDTAPDLILGQVDRDREDPGGELSALPIALAIAIDPEEDLLADLLGAVPIVDEPAHEIHDSRAVPLDERPERRLGAQGAALHDVFVRQLGKFELFH